MFFEYIAHNTALLAPFVSERMYVIFIAKNNILRCCFSNSADSAKFGLCLSLQETATRTFSVRKGAFRNFAKFTGKHLCQSLFFNRVAGWACNFIKKETLAQVFSCEFCEISKNTIFKEHLWVTASALHFVVT